MVNTTQSHTSLYVIKGLHYPHTQIGNIISCLQILIMLFLLVYKVHLVRTTAIMLGRIWRACAIIILSCTFTSLVLYLGNSFVIFLVEKYCKYKRAQSTNLNSRTMNKIATRSITKKDCRSWRTYFCRSRDCCVELEHQALDNGGSSFLQSDRGELLNTMGNPPTYTTLDNGHHKYTMANNTYTVVMKCLGTNYKLDVYQAAMFNSLPSAMLRANSCASLIPNVSWWM